MAWEWIKIEFVPVSTEVHLTEQWSYTDGKHTGTSYSGNYDFGLSAVPDTIESLPADWVYSLEYTSPYFDPSNASWKIIRVSVDGVVGPEVISLFRPPEGLQDQVTLNISEMAQPDGSGFRFWGTARDATLWHFNPVITEQRITVNDPANPTDPFGRVAYPGENLRIDLGDHKQEAHLHRLWDGSTLVTSSRTDDRGSLSYAPWVWVKVGPVPIEITSDGGGDTAAISILKGTTAVTTVSATTPASDGAMTYRIIDNNFDFQIDPSTGALSFKNPANFLREYRVTILAADKDSGNNATGDYQEIRVTVTEPGTLFTQGADSIDFNQPHVTLAPRIAALDDSNDLYRALNGNDKVTLPGSKNYQLTESIGWDPTQVFYGGDGQPAIDDGQDTFIIPPLSNFHNDRTNVQKINGGSNDWEMAGAVGRSGDLIRLPGSSGDYKFEVEWSNGGRTWSNATTTITAPNTLTGIDLLRVITQDIERVQFENPINNNVRVTDAGSSTDGNLIAEMARLAWESYGNHSKRTDDNPERGNPHDQDPLSWMDKYDTKVTEAAMTRGWHAMSAMELGILPSSFSNDASVPHPYGTQISSGSTSLVYSFDRGLYMASDPGIHKVPFSVYVLHAAGSAEQQQSSAMVLTGVVDGKKTLSIAFRGTDQVADFADYPYFKTHYAKYKPLIDGLKHYLENNAIDQVLVTGHSLGAAMVQYFLQEDFLVGSRADSPNTPLIPRNAQDRPSVYAFTFGSPGAEDPGEVPPSLAAQLINFVNTDDLVPKAQEATSPDGIQLITGVLKKFGNLIDPSSGIPFVPSFVDRAVDALAGDFQQKTRAGTTIEINSDVFTMGERSFFGLIPLPAVVDATFSEHNIRLYFNEMLKLGAFADDIGSPFRTHDLGQFFQSDIQDPHGQGTLRIALGSPFLPNAPVPESLSYKDVVHSTEADQYVLGNVGKDNIHWGKSFFAGFETGNRIVDGGDSPTYLDEVFFATKRSEWGEFPNVNGHWLVHYMGGLVGELHRVATVKFAEGSPDNPLGIIHLDGRAVTVQHAPSSNSASAFAASVDAPVFQLSSGFDAADAGNGNLIVEGTDQSDSIYFGSGNKTINAREGNDYILVKADSSSTADTIFIDGGAGADVMRGGSGQNTYIIDNTNDLVLNGGGLDIVKASVDYTLSEGVEQLMLLDGATTAIGNELDNLIQGNSADNILDGQGGNDTLDGGRGFDTVVFSGIRALYTLTRAGASVVVDGPDGHDILTVVERIQFADTTISIRHSRNDFDGDSKSDVLFSLEGAVYASNYEWRMNDRAINGQGAIDLYDKSFTLQIVGDYDGDGKSDVVFQNPTTGGVWQWLLDGTVIKSQGAVDVADPSYHLLGSADFNGDGKSDLLFRNDAGFVYMWQMDGRIDTPLPVGALDPQWHVAGAGDFDGNGNADLLLHNVSATSDNGAYFLWKMDGSAIAGQGGIERPDASWHTLAVGDFDGDGKSDFAIRNESLSGDNGAVWVYLMDGITIKSQGAAGIVKAAEFSTVGVGDYNGDGKDDILFRNSGGYFYSWNMNGKMIQSEGPFGAEAGNYADPAISVVTQHWDLA